MTELEKNRQILDTITFSIGDPDIVCRMPLQRPMQPFAKETLELLQTLSAAIRNDAPSRGMPELSAFGFWCRKASLVQQEKLCGCAGTARMGRGVSLHFAPSNIPLLFAYTMAAGLLAGNCVMVRLPSREMPETERLLRVMKKLLAERPEWQARIACFRYAYNKEVTDALSGLCDVRIIWGGDASVAEIRRSPLAPDATDLPFANRHSAAVFRASAVLETDNLADLVKRFYNDTYRNDQNACSSPGLIYWIGNETEIKAAQARFWAGVSEYLTEHFIIQPDLAVKKYEKALMIAAAVPEVNIIRQENAIIRVAVPQLSEGLWEMLSAGGFFVETFGSGISGLLPVLGKQCQTLTVFGYDRESIVQELLMERVRGVDRVVEVGHALDFSLIWDGRNLIEAMSRQCVL